LSAVAGPGSRRRQYYFQEDDYESAATKGGRSSRSSRLARFGQEGNANEQERYQLSAMRCATELDALSMLGWFLEIVRIKRVLMGGGTNRVTLS
jgi:hypothetical protein